MEFVSQQTKGGFKKAQEGAIIPHFIFHMSEINALYSVYPGENM